MKPNIHLLLIDPQNDFCDLPPSHCPPDPTTGAASVPALPVKGAHDDMLRLATLIARAGQGISDITVTLDSHQRIDVAHPTYWRQGDGSAVAPFTPITAAQMRAGAFKPRDATLHARTLNYLVELEARGRYQLMVWPVHCEIGSWGHNVHADLRQAYNAWEEATGRSVFKVTKGESPFTEHYSAVMAEVPLAEEPHTQLNQSLLNRLKSADTLLIAGEASSHCVRATTEHVVEQLGAGFARRIVILTDAMSPVAGFEPQHHAFLDFLRGLGARLATTAQIAGEIHP
jgi:nicotinamidase/pyrazinamidase